LIWFAIISLLNQFTGSGAKMTLLILLLVGIFTAIVVFFVIMKLGPRNGRYFQLLFFPPPHPMEEMFRFQFSWISSDQQLKKLRHKLFTVSFFERNYSSSFLDQSRVGSLVSNPNQSRIGSSLASKPDVSKN
jgi:hypothetical protein